MTDVTSAERDVAGRLKRHVEQLAEPRTVEDAGIQERVIHYIETELRACGYNVKRQRIRDARGVAARPNLVVEIEGTSPDAPLVVVGAHYDSVPASPGADDNASGCAVLLELARALKGRTLPRPMRLVFFSEEEVDLGGSRFFAADLRAQHREVAGMISLEMLGYYSDAEGSQRYPLEALTWLYPSRGDFVAMVANPRSRTLLRTCVGSFREAVAFPCEGLVAPELLRDIGRSDNAPFWHEGYPAIMVTDTSNFRNPHYHRPSDRPETLDYDRMARVAGGVRAMVERLATP